MNKSDDFEVLTRRPFNGQPRLADLVEEHVTPVERFYVRNHAPVPRLEEKNFRLDVGGMVERPLHLKLEDLRENFPVVESTVTLQCAGNRREEMDKVREIPGEEVLWGASGLGNAVWRGVALKDVLEAAGVFDGARHVAFLGLDRVERDGVSFGFGGSIPVEKALDPHVLLAWEMNGEPLPPEHGFPLRAVVPGYIGARSVKWLAQIEVQMEPSDNYYQQLAYKHFPSRVSPEDVDWDEGFPLGELSVNSAICSPVDGAEIEPGPVAVEGYAMAGGSRVVERVEVSADNGSSWTEADVDEAPVGVWRFWRAELDLEEGPHELVCRAWDSAANTQPEDPTGVWNFKGYMHHAWHRVRIWCQEEAGESEEADD